MTKRFTLVDGRRRSHMSVQMAREEAETYLAGHPFRQVDTEDGDSWLELSQPHQAMALAAAVECIQQVTWEGAGWYRAFVRKDVDRRVVSLERDDRLFERLRDRTHSTSNDFDDLRELLEG